MVRSKLSVILIIIMLMMTVYTFYPKDILVEASSFAGDDIIDIDLDLQFIYNVTQNLSNVVFDAYDDGELQKSRAFGTKGEHYAAEYLYNVMNVMYHFSEFLT